MQGAQHKPGGPEPAPGRGRPGRAQAVPRRRRLAGGADGALAPLPGLLLGGLLGALLGPLAALPARAQAPLPAGYLCCNLRVANDWISDINYRQEGARMLPAGTWVEGTAWGRYSVGLRVGVSEYWLGNDYSRALDDRQFTQRYIVATDPRARIQAADSFFQDAIRRARLMPGMNEAEVAIALGFPVANYTPRLSADQWQYWIDRTGEFIVHFDADRRVRAVTGEARVLAVVLWTAGADLVRRGQARLNEYGFEAGEPDGRVGPLTRAALRDFQSLNELPTSGQFDRSTLRRLGVEP